MDDLALYTRMELRIKGFEQQLAKATRAADGGMNRIEKRSAAMSRKVESELKSSASKLGNAFGNAGIGLATGAVAGVAGFVSLQAAITKTKDALSDFSKIQDTANATGLDSEFLQAFTYQAGQAGVEAEELSGALSTFTKNAGLAAAGKGKMVAGLKALNPELLKNIQAATNQEERLRLAANAIDMTRDATDKAALSSVLFGNAGVKMVEVFRGGAAEMENMASQAKSLGLIVDRELIAKSEALGDELETVSKVMDLQLSQAMIDLAPIIIGTTKWIAGMSRSLRYFLDLWHDYENRSAGTMDRQLQEAGLRRLEIENQIIRLREEQDAMGEPNAYLGGGIDNSTAIAQLEEEAAALSETEKRILKVLADRAATTSKTTKDAGGAVDGLNDSLEDTEDAAALGTKGIDSYADAIRALKNEIPELAEELSKLDAKMKIDNVYKSALSKARTIGQTIEATALRDKALSSLSVKTAGAAPTNYLKGYLNGKPESHVSGFDADFSKKLAEMFASAPAAVQGATKINSGFRSFQRQAELFDAAVAKYGSPEAARKWVAPPGKSQHNQGNAADLGFGTGEARDWFHQNAAQFGLSFPMGHEPWHVEDAGARTAANDDAFKAKYEGMTAQADAYTQIVAEAERYIASQQAEAQAIGMTTQAAAALKYEQQLMNEAAARDIEMTPERIAKLKALAKGMAEVETATAQVAESQAAMAEAGDFLTDQIGEGLIDVILNAENAEDALKGMLKQLAAAALQATLMGKGPLAGIFGTADSGGLIGNALSLFGFADGGIAARGKPLPRFAGGGISRSAAIFGEAGPEAAVPLPDGRRIPVDLNIPAIRTPSIPQRQVAPQQGVKVDVGVSVDSQGELQAYVKSISRQTMQSGISQYDKVAKRALPQRMAEAQIRDF